MFDMLKDISLDILGFGVGAGLTLSFIVIHKTGKEIVQRIKDLPELSVASNITCIIKDTAGVEACIWGKVEPDDIPICSMQNPKVSGVIWKHTIREHIIAQIMGVWTNDKKTIDETTRSVPFSIVSDGIKVKVSTPSKLEDVDLSVVSEKFVSANNSLADHIWGFVKGIRSAGTQYTEEMLVVGTRVLGFGKLVYEKGTLCIKPHPSIPFILTTKDKQGVIEDYESPMTALKIMSLLSACSALYFTYRIGRKLIRRWKDYKKMRQETLVLDKIRQWKAARDVDIPESLMCLVCCGLRDVLIMPCKHVCVCGECYQKLDPKLCPVCRSEIESIEPIFYS